MRLDNKATCLLRPYHKTERHLCEPAATPPAADDLNEEQETYAGCPYFNYEANAAVTYTGNASDDFVITHYSKVSNTEQMPVDLQHLVTAIREPLPDDYDVPGLPAWLDIERLKRGQTFATKYLYGVNYADTLSLMFLFASADGLKPLIFTEKSHTCQLARKRYLSTVLRVKSWYETEIWQPTSEGYQNLQTVRALHLNVSKRLNKLSVDRVHRYSDLEEKLKSNDTGGILCPLLDTLKKDFEINGAAATYPLKTPKGERVYFNQLEMVATQFGFFGLMLVYPEKFGAKWAGDHELSCFVHLWRYIGYMLGIKDEYNLCEGELEEVRRRSVHIIEYLLIPTLMRVSKEWEHMTRSALQGIEKFTDMVINFEVAVLYLCWVLHIETPHLLQYVGWKEQLLFKLTKLMMTESYKVPGFGRLCNYAIKKRIEKAAQKERSTTI